jgi:fatty acid desaturase
VNKLMNWLHNNVSYHVEHHLFPSLNYHYAPQLSELLRSHYSDHYQVHSLFDAWRALFAQEIYLIDSAPLAPLPSRGQGQARQAGHP